jgi:branched-chain amino acid transport system permease protein
VHRPRPRRFVRAGFIAFVIAGAAATASLAAAPATAATPTPTATASTGAVAPPIKADVQCAPSDTIACVAGTLRDGDSNPVKNVGITLSDAAGDTAVTKTDSNGAFGFDVTKAGDYTAKIDTATLPKGLKVAVPSLTVSPQLGSLRAAFFKIAGTQGGGETNANSSSGSGTNALLRIWDEVALGLLLGLLLALASIGLSLIYGTTGLSNFAHGEQVTLGGILAYQFAVVMNLPFVLAAVLAVIVCAATGYVQDRLIWGPLRKRGLGLTQLMVVTIGLSLALSYVFQFFFGAAVLPITPSIQLNMGPLDITPNAYVSMAISIVALVLVGLALQRTRIGRATRAVSDNRALAAASGIDTDRIIRLVWTIAMALAGLAGILYALVYGGISWNTGAALLLLIYAAVTLGGLGTAFGALVGSIVIGLVTQLSSLVLSADLKYATALVILILVLLFRPQGILGRKERVG